MRYQSSKKSGHLSSSPNLAEHSDSYGANFFAQLFELKAKNFWFLSRNQVLIWVFKSIFPIAHFF